MLLGVDLPKGATRTNWLKRPLSQEQLLYAEALAQGMASDKEQGFTHTGPQRADIRVTIDGHSAAETLSRGQQKLAVCGMKLAQGQMMSEAGNGKCTF